MDSLSKKMTKFNKNSKFNFDGGSLSSDSGLILSHSFNETIGIEALMDHYLDFTEKDKIKFKQRILMTSCGYHEDTVLKELKDDPILTDLLDREHLFSQSTMSRFDNSLDTLYLEKFEQFNFALLKKSYETNQPKRIILDVDSTGIRIFGEQENKAFNGHIKKMDITL